MGTAEASHIDVEGALESDRAFHQAVLDGLAEPIMVIAPDHRVRLVNRAARKLSPVDSPRWNEPVLCYQISHRRATPCQGSEHPCPLEQVRESGMPTTVIHEHFRVDGERRFVEILASPLWGPDGVFQGIVESVRDITDRIAAEKELRLARAGRQALIDEERTRIAYELHDGLGQVLGYVNTKAMAVRLMLNKGQLAEAERHLCQLEEASRSLFVDVRQAILDLRTIACNPAGLVATLRDFASQFTRLSDLPVDIASDDKAKGTPLSSDVELHLVRIVQEALGNVRKHALASRASVHVGIIEGELVLTISDDGLGFDPASSSTRKSPHFGLSMMRERAEAVGAAFSVTSGPGDGTRVTVCLPLKGA